MLLLGKSRFWHGSWLAACTVITAVSISAYLAFPESQSLVLLFGAAAAILFVFEMLYWVQQRRSVRRILWRRGFRTGKAAHWMIAHIWLGLLTVPLVVLHARFSLGGPLSTALTALFAVVICSGVYGLWLQTWIPHKLRTLVPDETEYSDIPHVIEGYCRDADILVDGMCGSTISGDDQRRGDQHTDRRGVQTVSTGAKRSWSNVSKFDQVSVQGRLSHSDAMERAYLEEIRPFLRHGSRYKRNGCLAETRGSEVFFDELRSRLEPEAGPGVKLLESWCEHRRHFETQIYWHERCHRWRSVHLAFAFGLIVLLLPHVVLSLKFVYQ